jgi:predicted DNA-binding transcriptional regulator YafY
MTEESSPNTADLRWGVERRLAFIEHRLFWYGEINRAALVERFDVSMSQASADISRYVALNPAGMDYDRSAKRYVAVPEFTPVLSSPDASRILGELRLVDAALMTADQTTLGIVPPFDVTPVPERKIDAPVLRTILRAIRDGLSVDALYQSMSRPERVRRMIEPHALAFDGFRWHARALDAESGEFRDFVLGRLSKARLGAKAQGNGKNDKDWQQFVELEIAPHPALTEAQARAIALDYGITRGSIRIPVRRAMLFYALKRLGLDRDSGKRPPSLQQIVLLNRDEIDTHIGPPQT